MCSTMNKVNPDNLTDKHLQYIVQVTKSENIFFDTPDSMLK